jgi:hypothetical protein
LTVVPSGFGPAIQHLVDLSINASSARQLGDGMMLFLISAFTALLPLAQEPMKPRAVLPRRYESGVPAGVASEDDGNCSSTCASLFEAKRRK